MFLKGVLIGFSIAAPVGPIGVLCIRRTLSDGRLSGLVAGLGAATADAVYGSVAGFGLTAISGLLIGHAGWLRVLGGTFLCYLGARTFLTQAVAQGAVARRGLLGGYASTFVLTLTNPMTILSFGAIFAGLGLVAAAGTYAAAAALVAGVFAGSALWWLMLTLGVGTLRGRLNPGALRWVNRVAGIVITAFGLVVLAALRR